MWYAYGMKFLYATFLIFFAGSSIVTAQSSLSSISITLPGYSCGIRGGSIASFTAACVPTGQRGQGVSSVITGGANRSISSGYGCDTQARAQLEETIALNITANTNDAWGACRAASRGIIMMYGSCVNTSTFSPGSSSGITPLPIITKECTSNSFMCASNTCPDIDGVIACARAYADCIQAGIWPKQTIDRMRMNVPWNTYSNRASIIDTLFSSLRTLFISF